MRQIFSHLVYALSVGCQLNRVTRRANRHKAVILAYHRLHAGEADQLENFDGQFVHVDDFARQMRYLARHYHVVSLDDCFTPHADQPYRAAVTFDDAYASIYQYAYPIMRELRLPGTVFVPTDFIQTRTPMWWDQLRCAIRATTKSCAPLVYESPARALALRSPREKEAALRALARALRTVSEPLREELFAALYPPRELRRMAERPHTAPLTLAQMREMAAHGWTFAAHGKSHASLPTLTPPQLWQEVSEPKALLEAWTGQRVSWFSYPFGDVDARALALLPRAGYQAAVTTVDGLSHDEPRFTRRRIAVGGHTTFAQFVAAVGGVRDLVAHVRRRDRRALPA
jgi:peptidoglycan/xylan/chitin deacetylase (PgdA/CDA1 family)